MDSTTSTSPLRTRRGRGQSPVPDDRSAGRSRNHPHHHCRKALSGDRTYPGYAGGSSLRNRVHFVFTFHDTAALVLERIWEANRLPPFEASSSNVASVVVLRGLKDDTQVSDLLRVYLGEQREGHVEDDLLPFDLGAITLLRDVSDGRVGILLNRARELFDFAAEHSAPRITGELASRSSPEQVLPTSNREARTTAALRKVTSTISSSAPDDEIMPHDLHRPGTLEYRAEALLRTLRPT